ERRGAQQRPAGAPRRQRAAEEAPERSQDLGRRRAKRARRSAEAHRQSHPPDRRPAEEKGSRAPRKVIASFFSHLECSVPCGAPLGLDRLYVKDESLNPTNSFKARGQSAAITRAKYLGADTIALPTAGNAGNAAAAYAAAAGLACEVFIPKDAKRPFIDECRLYGANVTLVDGLITDAGRMAAEKGAPLGWYDVSTLKEPYRIEGKKTMGYELAEQMNWTLPDWIIYPTGGGTGMVGMWKAFDEMERIGWLPRGKRPKMVSVQAEQCAPIVRAFQRGEERAQPWEGAKTIA